jgi:hypothetical protein
MLPWLLPGTLLAVLVGAAISGWGARVLRTRPIVAWVLVASLGIILSATLTPLHGHFLPWTIPPLPCDLSRVGIAPMADLLRPGDTSLNVLLFVPFGVSLGLLPGSRSQALLIVGAVALPFAIELTQLLVPPMGRGCQSADVIDNLTGLVIGLAFGWLLAWLVPALRRPEEEPGAGG